MGILGTRKRTSSVTIAKDRLKMLLVSDRVNCTPDALEKIEKELYHTISKYMSVEQNEFDVRITRNYIYIKLTGEDS